MAELDPNTPPPPQDPTTPPPAVAPTEPPTAAALPPASDRALANLAADEPKHHSTLYQVCREIFIRAYSLCLLLAVTGLSAYAFVTLLQTVFVPTPVPKRFLDWQGRVDAAALREQNVAGMTGEAARSPLGHYHQIERWFQPDPLNSCTLSSCHDPLPHKKSMKIPAFANFHTTFLTCQMCHTNSAAKPAWVSTATATTQEIPALLQLLGFIETSGELVRTNPGEAHQKITGLLRQTLAIAGKDAALRDLLLQFDTSEPGSPVWRRALDRASAELPLHARGEYGAKITRDASPGAYRQSSDNMRTQAAQYHAAAINTPPRAKLHSTIHGDLLKEPANCVTCHGGQTPSIDFTALGYSPRRAAMLGHLQLANLMQQIRQGERFHIPQLLGGADAK